MSDLVVRSPSPAHGEWLEHKDRGKTMNTQTRIEMGIKSIIRGTTVILALGTAVAGCDVEDEADMDAVDKSESGTCAPENSALLDGAIAAASGASEIVLEAVPGASIVADIIFGSYDSGGCEAGDLSAASLAAIKDIVTTAIDEAAAKFQMSYVTAVQEYMRGYVRPKCQQDVGAEGCNLDLTLASTMVVVEENISTVDAIYIFFSGSGSTLFGTKEMMVAASLSTSLELELVVLRRAMRQDGAEEKFNEKVESHYNTLAMRYEEYSNARKAYDEIREVEPDTGLEGPYRCYYEFTRPNGSVEQTSPSQKCEDDFDDIRAKLDAELAAFEGAVIGNPASFERGLGALKAIVDNPLPCGATTENFTTDQIQDNAAAQDACAAVCTEKDGAFNGQWWQEPPNSVCQCVVDVTDCS